VAARRWYRYPDGSECLSRIRAGANQTLCTRAGDVAYQVMGAAPAEEQGVASGARATTRVIGQSLSVAVAGAVFTSFRGAAAGAALSAGRATLSVEQVRALQHTFVSGLHAAFVVCAVLAAGGVVTALFRGKESGAPTPLRKV
jgi:hypothetical protein